MIDIEIDDVKLTVPQNCMIIEAADKAGINIPRFCYHKKLQIAANCRMCLVEVDKVGKPLPACATPVSQGMRVFTRSAKALEAQRSVMEFLLINHPLDCPICDQGGECELQDISMGYGSDSSRFSEAKRAVADENLGSLIASDMTRCIQCTRCVRFGQEIAGVRELGATGRGEHMEIETYVKHVLTSELSGNIIDLCPVGALTSKPFRFQARSWELDQVPSIAPHDAVGSHVYIHSRRGKVMRVVPREEDDINEVWISDRDRFSYLGINSEARLQAPMIKTEGEWFEVDWQTALNHVVTSLTAIIQTNGADQIAALGSPSLTVEECYLLQKIWRDLGGIHMDHRLHQIDFNDQASASLYPGLHSSLVELENRKSILVIGSDIHHEQPLIAHRLRKASLQGAKVMVINPMNFELHFPVMTNIVVHPLEIPHQLAAIIKALDHNLSADFTKHFEHVEVLSTHKDIAEQLKNNESISILLGAAALNHPQASLIRWLATYLSELLDEPTAVGELTEGANAAGAYFAGLLPHRTVAGKQVEQIGFNAQQMFEKPLKSYCLVGFEPALDLANSNCAIKALEQAEFVVAMTAFKTQDLLDVADVLLPIATFAETSGTFVNAEGRWQSFTGSVSPVGEARPLWKILRVLGNLLQLEGYAYHSSEAVRDEILDVTNHTPVWEKTALAFPEWASPTAFQAVARRKRSRGASLPNEHMSTETSLQQSYSLKGEGYLTRLVGWPIYRVDPLVRQSEALQKTPTQYKAGVYINAQTAKTLGLVHESLVWVTETLSPGASNASEREEGKEGVGLTLFIDAAIPDGCAYIPAGYTETSLLGENCGEIYIDHA